MSLLDETKVKVTLDSNLYKDLQQQLHQIEKNLSLTIGSININNSQLEQLAKSMTITPKLDARQFYADAKNITDTIKTIHDTLNQPAALNTAKSGTPNGLDYFQSYIGGIGVAVTAVTALTSIINTYNKQQDIARENAVAYAKESTNKIQTLGQLRNEYIDIINSTQSELLKTQELEYWKRQLVEVYGLEKEALQGVNLERLNSLDILDMVIAKEQLAEATKTLARLKDYEKAVNAIETPGAETLRFSFEHLKPIAKDIENELKKHNIELQKEIDDTLPVQYILHLPDTSLNQRNESISEIITFLTNKDRALNTAEQELLEYAYNEIANVDKVFGKFGDTYTLGNEATAMQYKCEFIIENNGRPIDHNAWRELVESLDVSSEAKTIILSYISEVEARGAQDLNDQLNKAYNTTTDLLSQWKQLDTIYCTIEIDDDIGNKIDPESFHALVNIYPEVMDLENDIEEIKKFISDRMQEIDDAAFSSFANTAIYSQNTADNIQNHYASLPDDLNDSYIVDRENFAAISDGKYETEKQNVARLTNLWQTYVQLSRETEKSSMAALPSYVPGFKPLFDMVEGIQTNSPMEGLDKKYEEFKSNYLGDSSKTSSRPSGGSRSSAASTKDTHKEAYDNEIKDLEYEYKARNISEEEYLKRRTALNDQYFKDQEKYVDLYRQNALKDSQDWEKLQEDKINKQKNYNDKMLQALQEDPILNSGQIVSLMREQEELQKQLYQTTFDQREKLLAAGFEETDKEIIELNIKLLEIEQQLDKTADSIYSHFNDVLKAEFADIDATIGKHKDKISELDSAYRELEDNQVSEKIANINARMDEHTIVANQTADKIDLLNQRYQAGEISIDDYNSTLQALNKEQREALSSLTDMDKELERQIELVMDAYYNYSFGEKQKEINALQNQLDAIGEKYQKQISLIDNEISALRERNKETENQKKLQERIYELEKLQLELENTRNEKNIRQLTQNEDGSYDFTYVANQEKIDGLQEQIQKKKDDIQDIYREDALQAQIKVLEERKNTLNKQMEAEKGSLSELIGNLQTFLDEEKDKYSNRNKLLITSEEELREALKDVDASMYADRLEYLDIFDQIFQEKAAGTVIGVQVDDDTSSVDRFWEQLHLSNQTNYEQEEMDMRHSEEQKTNLRHKSIEGQKEDEEQKNKDLIKKLKSYMEEVLSRTKSHDETVALMADQMRILLNSIDSLMYSERLAALEAFVDAWNAEIARMESASILDGGSSSSMGTYSEGGVVPKTGIKLLHEGERVLTVQQTNLFDKAMNYWGQLDSAVQNANLSRIFEVTPQYGGAVSTQQTTTSKDIHINNLTLNQPNVKDANDFARAMQNFPALVKQVAYQ